MDRADSDDSDMEDCKCITCQAEQVGMKQNEAGYENELRRIILTGRNKEPFPDWDMVSGFFDDCFNPFFRGPNLYSCYRLMTNNYNRHQWLSGCPGFTNFFCFSCALFGKGEDDACFMVGEIELPDITVIAAKHSITSVHLKYLRKWLSYDQPAHFCHLDEQERKRIFVHDEIIRRRRAVACFVMTAVVLLASQGLPFRKKALQEEENVGQSSHNDESNPGPFMVGKFFETLQVIRQQTENEEITGDLKFSFLEWLTLDAQTKFISAIAGAIRMNVKSQLDKSEFVSVIIDTPMSIPDIDGPRTSTILRFVDDKAGVSETFLGLYDVERDHNSLFSHVREIVESYSLKDKLVAVACDGGCLVTTSVPDFRNKMLESFPRALLVHCYSHMADYVILESMRHENDTVDSFLRLFSMIDGLFRGSEERQKDLRKFISQKSRIHQPLNFDQKLIHTLNHYRNQFIDYFITLPNKTSLYNVERDRGVLDEVCKLIKEVKSAFCIKLFSKICLLLEPLNNTISARGVDVSSCSEQVRKCLAALKELKDQGFDSMWAFVKAASGEEVPSEDLKTYEKVFNDILDHVINHITVRFDYLTSMDFLSLLDPKRFSAYRNDFPEAALKSLINQYNMFQPQLQEELRILYKNQKLYNKNITELLKHFNVLQSKQLPEVRKLVNLILTFPLSPISTEMSKYKKVEDYIRLSKGIDLKESLTDLSLIYLEKLAYIGELDAKTVESRKTIDKIIDLFAESVNKKDHYRYINPN